MLDVRGVNPGRTSGLALLFCAVLVGCGGKTADEDSSAPTDTQAPDTDTGEALPEGMPPNPAPFTVNISGAIEESLVFDTPSCSHPTGSANFRAFWRNGAGDHVFVLFAEILGDYTKPGTYNGTDHNARVKLQEEAGGSGYYFSADADEGDTLTITVESVGKDGAWGEFMVSGMHADEGAITLTPGTVPIWCDEVD